MQAVRRRFQKSEGEERLRNKITYKKYAAIYKKELLAQKKVSFRTFLNSRIENNFEIKSLNLKFKREMINFVMTKDDGEILSDFGSINDHILDFHFPPKRGRNWTKLDVDESEIDYFTHSELDKIMRKMKTGKAPGIDELTIEIVREIYYADKDWFLGIFNHCLKLGIFPKIWKIAKVVLIPKDVDNLSDPSKFRPICLLPVWGKILDALLAERLTFELEKWLSSYQFGFRKGKSTVDALRTIIDKLVKNGNEGYYTCLITLDFKNAFNNASWEIIGKHIDKLNIKNYFKNILNDFISDRKVRGSNEDKTYGIGIPQGSCMGPKLWLLLIDEILGLDFLNENIYLQAFADDIIILIRSKVSYRFEKVGKNVLDELFRWITDNELELNINKCEYLIVKFNMMKVTRIPPIKINGSRLKYSNKLKYLGIVIDERLNWLSHIRKVRDKANLITNKVNRLARPTWGIKPIIVKMVYKLVTEKILKYAGNAWYRESVKINRLLIQAQRSSLLGIVKAYRTVASDTLAVLAGVIPLDIQIKYDQIRFELCKMGKDRAVGSTFIKNDEIDSDELENLDPQFYRKINWGVFDDESMRKDESCGMNQEGRLGLNDRIRVFTDGSKIEEKVGGAFVVFKNGLEIYNLKFRIGDNSSVFVAELAALEKAVDWIILNKVEKVDLVSDCRSVLMCMDRVDNTKVINRVKNKLKDCMKVKLYWTRAHVGTFENERADALAKEGTQRSIVDIEKRYTCNEVKSLSKKDMIREWQKRWDESENGRWTWDLIPKVRENVVFGDFYINQVLTGHGAFPVYQNRFFGKTLECYFCEEIGTISHLVYSCHYFDNLRKLYFPDNYRQVPLKHMTLGLGTKQGLRHIMSQCLSMAMRV